MTLLPHHGQQACGHFLTATCRDVGREGIKRRALTQENALVWLRTFADFLHKFVEMMIR